jgi:Domain of unknown function (DUF4201)
MCSSLPSNSTSTHVTQIQQPATQSMNEFWSLTLQGEASGALHVVDFDQLKIENQQHLERLDARNRELLRVKATTGSSVQARCLLQPQPLMDIAAASVVAAVHARQRPREGRRLLGSGTSSRQRVHAQRMFSCQAIMQQNSADVEPVPCAGAERDQGGAQ